MFASAATGQTKRLSDEDRIVACTILAEARGEGRGGMYAVAVVIAQRALNRKLTPDKVCLEDDQFECWTNPTVDSYRHLLDDSSQATYARGLASAVNLGYKQKRNYIDRAKYKYVDHFFNPRHASPSWEKKAIIKYRIGNHTFLRLKEKPAK